MCLPQLRRSTEHDEHGGAIETGSLHLCYGVGMYGDPSYADLSCWAEGLLLHRDLFQIIQSFIAINYSGIKKMRMVT